jgi:group I intron endonuclease
MVRPKIGGKRVFRILIVVQDEDKKRLQNMGKPDMTRNAYFHCYKITCVINGKGYIGIASNGTKRRFIQHKHDARKGADTPLHAAIRKYGEDNFQIEVIAKSTDWDEICNIEREMIASHNTLTQHGKGYNISTGGEGPFGVKRSGETRRKLSKIAKQWLAGDPSRIKHLEEVGREQAAKPGQKELSRAGAKQAWNRPDYREKAIERARKWAQENKELMIKNQKEVMARPGTRDNLRKKAKKQMEDPKNRELSKDGALKQWQNKEFKEKMTHRMKSTAKKNWETPEYRSRMKIISCKPIIAGGQYYTSLEEAAIALNVKSNTICTRLKNPNFPDYYYLPPKRYLLINGNEFPSINAAAKSLGISNAVCQRRLESKDYPEYVLVDNNQELTSASSEK